VNGIPKFTALLQNDIHSYQKWVILKESKNSCLDKEYTLVQYLDGNNCKTLMFSRATGKELLVYKNGIITTPQDNSRKVIIKARFETSTGKNI
jgi:hypothetical protein